MPDLRVRSNNEPIVSLESVSMSPHSVKRNRAVRLTAEASALLSDTLHQKGQAKGQRGRLTQELTAELLGVSTVTARRILHRKGVDRATLIVAFGSLGLAWRDSYCEPAVSMVASPEPPRARMDGAASPVPVSSGLGRAVLRVSAAFVLVALIGIGALASLKAPVDSRFPEPILSRSGSLVSQATEKYHAGEITRARSLLLEAVQINRLYKGPSELAESLKILGDVEAALGNLKVARSRYQEVLQLRSQFLEDERNGSILEALGVLKTRLGDLSGARRDLEQSLKLFRDHGDQPGVAMALRDLGTVAFLSGSTGAAESYFESALSAIRYSSKPDMEIDIRARQALVKANRGRINEAREQLDHCIAYWQAKHHPRWIAETELQLAGVEAQAGNDKVAIRLLISSLTGFRRVGDQLGVKIVTDRLTGLSPSSRSAR